MYMFVHYVKHAQNKDEERNRCQRRKESIRWQRINNKLKYTKLGYIILLEDTTILFGIFKGDLMCVTSFLRSALIDREYEHNDPSEGPE